MPQGEYLQLSKSEFAEGICEIGLFPEYAEFLASHVTVRCKRLIYGLTQIEFFDYRIGTQIDKLAYHIAEAGDVALFGAEGLDHERYRACNADCVGELNLCAVGASRRNDVLCKVTRGIRRAALDLCRILSGESAAAVT